MTIIHLYFNHHEDELKFFRNLLLKQSLYISVKFCLQTNSVKASALPDIIDDLLDKKFNILRFCSIHYVFKVINLLSNLAFEYYYRVLQYSYFSCFDSAILLSTISASWALSWSLEYKIYIWLVALTANLKKKVVEKYCPARLKVWIFFREMAAAKVSWFVFAVTFQKLVKTQW